MRINPILGTRVHVVGDRQAWPNHPSTGCPFCVGGLEAPTDYDVRWFPNRWPAMDGDRCEVVLYTPTHDASFSSLGIWRCPQGDRPLGRQNRPARRPRRCRLRARLRKPWARGGGDDRASALPDIRLRPRAEPTVAEAQCRVGAVRLAGRRDVGSANGRRIRRMASLGAVGTGGHRRPVAIRRMRSTN